MASTQDHNSSDRHQCYKQTKDIAKLLNDIFSKSEKHPVSQLKEIMELLNWDNVEYSIINVDFNNTEYFNYCAKSNGIVVYGTGMTRKDAKKNTAIAFLNKLRSNINEILTDVKKTLLTEHDVNYIGELQNLCMSLSLVLPSYEYAHDKNMFTVKCLLYGYITMGTSKIKQVAKRQAASLMYNQIKDIPQNAIKSLSHNECQSPGTVLEKNNNSVKGVRSDVALLGYNNFVNHNMTLRQDVADTTLDTFFDLIKSSKNPIISSLKKIERMHMFRVDSLQMLNDIANEEGFTVYYDIVPNESSNLLKIMIFISIAPALMHLGFGMTVISALREACYHVLLYLKLILTN